MNSNKIYKQIILFSLVFLILMEPMEQKSQFSMINNPQILSFPEKFILVF